MVNFPTSLDNFTNPVAGDALNSVTVPHATQHANLNDAVEALEEKVGADNSAVTSSIDYQIRQKQGVCEEKTTSFTAAVHGNYVVTGTATVTDPTPETGHGFTVLVRNGTVTVGGTAYSVVGTRIERTYHSGAWANAVWYPVTGGEGTATHVLTSNGAGVAPSFQALLSSPANNAITAVGNAATVPVTNRLTTVTNNSAATLTITMTTASAVNGQLSWVDVLDFSAVAQTITWVNTENSSVSAPTTSNGSTTLPKSAGFKYNSATSKWRCVAVA